MLPTPTLLQGLAALSVLYYVISSIFAWWRLRAFKGPFLASFSYIWILRVLRSGRHGEILRPILENQTVTRIGPNELITSDPSVIRRIHGTRKFYPRSNWYSINRFIPGQDSMFSLVDTAAHDRVKSQTSPGYSGKEIPGLEAQVDTVLAAMIARIRSKYASDPLNPSKTPKPSLDMAEMAQLFTLDTIMKIAFSEDFGFIESESDPFGYLEMVTESVPMMTCVSNVPPLARIVTTDWVFRLLVPDGKNPRGIFKIMRITRPIITKRFLPNAPPQNDMLGSFVRHGLTESQCNNEAILQVIAGSDTSATVIRATLLYIITCPRVYHTLQSEIDLAIRENRISAPVTSAEATTLPYLQAVIMEGLRIHPPFNSFPFKEVPPGGDTIDGKFVPAGTRVAADFVTFPRLKHIFGEDADVFRPERWLPPSWKVGGPPLDECEWGEGGRERVAEMRRTVDLVFGYGRFACAGKWVAFLELNKTFVELLRYFDFQLVDPTKPWESKNYSLFMQKNMWLKVALRR
ncbi:Pisatin demethylase [Podospora aff. communis PSN243]|uniref:Pisatin demethylase n=1 Tax=Podospora aff. communis PSN243 TaxID=3040156 RepID=A0AAV9FYN2_9PEZI|nr:Pisatin demethylase [Podospora aff. communis PSN243]